MTPLILSILGIVCSGSVTAAAGGDESPLSLLLPGSLPANLVQNQVTAKPVATAEGIPALEVHFLPADWPNVFFTAPTEGWNWSHYSGIAVDIYNPEQGAVNASMRVDNPGADGQTACNTATEGIEPGTTTTLRLLFRTAATQSLWGMRGLPEIGPVGAGAILDPSRVSAFQIFLTHPTKAHRLILSNFRFFGEGLKPGENLAYPFVDSFGQYKHRDWPGKIKEVTEFAARKDLEEQQLASEPVPPGLDRFGGWTEGPQLEATGWFRTEKVNDRWWLVTPEGHLFFSLGIDCVGAWEQTFVEKREHWFEFLPAAGDPLAAFFGQVSGAHSMADPIGGKGRTFNLYAANLMRKFGPEWREPWKQITKRRLHSWGFNTLGNWSDGELRAESGLPYVTSIHISSGLRPLEGARGYWGALKDVYDPHFADVVDESVAQAVTGHVNNPCCIGYFSDNELAWETIQKGVLACPTDQPCRQELIKRLQGKYASLAQLNSAWGASATSWDSLRAPVNLNLQAQEDLDGFAYDFSRRYFETIRAMLRNHARNQLYLGCRFSTFSRSAVRACADSAEVVSFNIYKPDISQTDCAVGLEFDRPLLIGEFHFGARDRGMFHPGLGPTRNQQERARSYQRYVQSAAACPSIVGCHWFQFVDEPVTGRWFDGENYNIGFVDVTDTPYPELLAAAKETHTGIYEKRYGMSNDR